MKTVVFLDMHDNYSLNMIVKTTQEEINFYLNLFAKEDDKKIGGGVGKKVFFSQLHAELKAKDAGFDKNPMLAQLLPQEWKNFIEDCLILACLDNILTGRPLPVIKDNETCEMLVGIRSVLGPPGVINHFNDE